MVAVDGSKNSHEAFDTACRLLNRGEDHLLIVTCAEKVQGKHLLPALTHKEKEAHEALTARVERAQKAIMEPFRELAEERGIKSTCIMLKGHHAGQMLCTLVDERNVDFLVVGRRGMNKVKRLLAGSTSKYVMEHASCNVVVVKGYFLPDQHGSVKEVDRLEEEERVRRLHLDEDREVAAMEHKERVAAHIGAVRDEEDERRRRVATERIIDDRVHLCEVLQFDSDSD